MSILSNRVERLEAKAGPVDIKVFIISFISPEAEFTPKNVQTAK